MRITIRFHRLTEIYVRDTLQQHTANPMMPYEPPLPDPPTDLRFGEVTLVLAAIVPGGANPKFVPYYYFQIIREDGQQVGHINFRVGDTPHVEFAAGHIGYEVRIPFRGHGYAYQACRAIEPVIRMFYESVLITCDPDNTPSRKTIERLGAIFMDEHAVPADDPHFQRGSATKLRFRWTPATK